MSKWICVDDICIPSDENDWEELVAFADAIAEQEPIDIVRCGECKHWNEEDHWCNIRDSYGWDYKPDDFCSYGSRSEKPNNSTISKMEQVDKDINVRSKEPQTVVRLKHFKCPKCGRSDYIRSFEDWGIDGGIYKYKCINCNTYIKDEPQTERSSE